MLVKYLLFKGKVRPSVFFRILMWGIAYKTHLPQNEAWVRGLVFSSFEGISKQEADQAMYRFYDEKVVGRIRKNALSVMQKHREEGRDIWVVSATFDPIIVRARKHLPFDYYRATQMKVDENGCYTREVEGRPVEGEEKLRQITSHANEVYGEGNWKLAYAYGDHYSDSTLLAAAEHPCAVTPGPTLQRHAEKQGWEILYWC
jgi:HAD superfamily hydrolase (TIGR01490 family)